MSLESPTTRPRRRSTSAVSPEAIVREGWNRRSLTYRPPRATLDCFRHTEADYRSWLRPLFERVAPGAPVLDLGCGNGVPASKALIERFDVTGVDISDVMIRRARTAIPAARFIRGDMTEVDFPPESFAAVISLYAIIHVPLAKQRPLLARIRSWLKPRGFFLAILGYAAYEATVNGWLGDDSPMFWSHADARTYRGWIREVGFTILKEAFIPEGDAGHELFLARKAGRPRLRS